MPPQNEAYTKGSQVRIAQREVLEAFRGSWMYHNPLKPEQLAYADRVATVKQVGHYFGGNVLYWLEGVPGTWHECCLTAVNFE
jgi:hypothetical protein